MIYILVQGQKKTDVQLISQADGVPLESFGSIQLVWSSVDWVKPIYILRMKICFTQSVDSNVNLIQKTLIDSPE